MLDSISTAVLGLDGRGNWGAFADYSQWEQWMRDMEEEPSGRTGAASNLPEKSPPAPPRKKLSYLEAREYSGMEERIDAAGERVRRAQEVIDDPAVAVDPAALTAALNELEHAQAEADALYARWAELSEKTG